MAARSAPYGWTREPPQSIALHMAMLERLFKRAADFDIIHFHIDGFHLPLSRRHEIFTAQLEASTYFDGSRLPELFCGFRRREGKPPTAYPVACSPQAWSAGAAFMLL